LEDFGRFWKILEGFWQILVPTIQIAVIRCGLYLPLQRNKSGIRPRKKEEARVV